MVQVTQRSSGPAVQCVRRYTAQLLTLAKATSQRVRWQRCLAERSSMVVQCVWMCDWIWSNLCVFILLLDPLLKLFGCFPIHLDLDY